MLAPNGITVALLPMDCINTQKGNGLLLKQELMKKHTLLGVMSLPDELFMTRILVQSHAALLLRHMFHIMKIMKLILVIGKMMDL